LCAGGASFSYLGGRRAILGTGREGTFASRHVWVGPTPAVHNDELFVFFGGTNIPEGANATCDIPDKKHTCVDPKAPGGRQLSGMGLVTTRPDGLASASVGYAEVGELLTAPVNISAARSLQLNVDCGGSGAVHVELLSGHGKPLPCHSLAQATPIWTNDLRATVLWGNSDGGRRCEGARGGRVDPGQAVQVRFVIENCNLYSMQFV
jgi:hypothetical protein